MSCNLQINLWSVTHVKRENTFHYLLWSNLRQEISKSSREFSRLSFPSSPSESIWRMVRPQRSRMPCSCTPPSSDVLGRSMFHSCSSLCICCHFWLHMVIHLTGTQQMCYSALPTATWETVHRACFTIVQINFGPLGKAMFARLLYQEPATFPLLPACVCGRTLRDYTNVLLTYSVLQLLRQWLPPSTTTVWFCPRVPFLPAFFLVYSFLH